MKNSLGNPARGEAFYDREKEIKKIYRALKSDANIYLSAPRRVGKTSILKYIEEKPEEGFLFIYIITESVYSKNEFYKVIFEELLRSDAIKNISKIYHKLTEAVTNLAGQVQSIQGVDLREAEEPDYYEKLLDFFDKITNEHGRVIIIIDEFPQTIQNIFQPKSEKEAGNFKDAQHFIQSNRELRHNKKVQNKVSFIYTGSLSLFPMVEKITNSLTAVNDLFPIEVGPLELPEAKDFLIRLLEEIKTKVVDKQIEYALTKIGWLTPFHIQLIAQEIIDVFESTNKPIDNLSIDEAFIQIIRSRNRAYFDPYFKRLHDLFKGDVYNFVMNILMSIANTDVMEESALHNISVKYKIEDVKSIMEVLNSDGYLIKEGNNYRYISPLLQFWCKNHICK